MDDPRSDRPQTSTNEDDELSTTPSAPWTQSSGEPADADNGASSSSTRFHLTSEELRQRAGASNLREDLRRDRTVIAKGKEPVSGVPEEGEEVENKETSEDASGEASEPKEEGAEFECNICFEMAADPVVTRCGHLFCWGCLSRWLQSSVICPVCKAGVKKETVIPVYARGSKKTDPRTRTEPRPQGERAAPEPRGFPFGGGFFPGGGFHGNAGGSTFSINAGFGLFPGLFGFEFQVGGGGGANAPRTPQSDMAEQQAFLSRIFLMLGILVVVSLLLF